MAVFNLTLSQMLMLFLLIFVGFLLRKKNIVPENSYKTISKMQTYVFAPALSYYTLIRYCTVESFAKNSSLILYGFILTVAAIAVAIPVCRLFVKAKDADSAYQQNVYKYALTFSNWGYLGGYVLLQVFGSETYFLYTMYTMLLRIFTTGWGLYILIPKEQGSSIRQNLIKGLTAPPMIAEFLGIICGFLGVYKFMPTFLLSALEKAGDCMGPMAMLLAGVVIGGNSFRSLITNKKVYVVSLLRLIVIPSAMLLVLHLIGAPEMVSIFTLFAFASPLGLNTIVYPAAYGGDTKTGASMTMVSSVFAIATIPLMYLFFIEILPKIWG